MSRTKLRALLGYLLMLVACLIPIYCFGQMVLQSLGQVKGHATFVKSMTTEMYKNNRTILSPTINAWLRKIAL